MVTPEYKKIEQYIWGLTPKIQGNVTSSKLTTIHYAIRMAYHLLDQVVRAKVARDADNKRKCKDDDRIIFGQNKRHEVVRAYAVRSSDKKGYVGTLRVCDKCKLYHHHGYAFISSYFSGVAPYNDVILEDLQTKHAFKPAPSLSHNHHLISSSNVVLYMIKSFPHGTSCRRDELCAQHLVDCLSGSGVAIYDELVSSITQVVNLFLDGNVLRYWVNILPVPLSRR
ncbi:hypothetical protein Tco_0840420 [Tanacetum coccineum]|uniref:Uncharacterized protein n=1 Tax=Tanacetum coccineum TaxID=301880 RepID=A0ABQ5AXF3_9ASTR